MTEDEKGENIFRNVYVKLVFRIENNNNLAEIIGNYAKIMQISALKSLLPIWTSNYMEP